jgi:hypothetical protein
MLVSNFSFDLVRNPNPKPFLPALHYLFSFDLNHCFQLVMVCVLAFWIISLSLEFKDMVLNDVSLHMPV